MKFIRRVILWFIIVCYTPISFVCFTLLLPILIIIAFSDGSGWKGVFGFWYDGAFVGIHIMRDES